MAQVKKPELRKAIVASAYRLFRDRTYLRTSVAEIARDAGIVPSNVYVYFNSKFEIFYAAYEPWLKKRLVRLERELSTIKDPNQKLAHIIDAVWVRMPTEDNGFANNLMQAVSTTDKDEPFRSDLLARSEKTLSQLLQTALPKARMDAQECDRLAHILLMAFDGFIVRSHVGGTRPDMLEIVATMAKLAAGGQAAGQTPASAASRRGKPARGRKPKLTQAH
jgi:AcrR family transcriptional regulator